MNTGTDVVVFKDVYKLRDKYGLDKWAFEIERHGAKGDNKTSYSILPEQRLDDAMRREIAQLELHDLEKVLNNSDASGDGEEQSFESYDNKQDASIDGAAVEKMLPRLKVLPRETLDRFLKKFEIQRVKDLRAKDAGVAFDFLGKLEAELHPAQEIDPFA